jgi:cysteine desulfuration protein SufE
VDSQLNSVAQRLNEIVAEFADLEPRERLELLLDFAEGLSPLPPRLQALRDAGLNRVHECQTPVYLWVEVEDSRVQIYADVAEEAPTVKGFVAVLVEAFSGATPEALRSVPPNLVSRLGLADALGMVRMRGLSAILNRVRTEAERVESRGSRVESQKSSRVEN